MVSEPGETRSCRGMGQRRCGRCSLLIWLALAFDVVGLALVVFGTFGHLQRERRNFGDFVIYSGGIVLFFSLLWWLLWYLCNLEVSLDELSQEPVPKHFSWLQLATKVSERLSQRKEAKDKKEVAGQQPQKSPLPLVHLNNGFIPELQIEGVGWFPDGSSTPDFVIPGDRLI